MDDQALLKHVPVMRDAAVGLLGCRSGGRYVDGTVGGGGYAEAILSACAPDGRRLALDWDAEAVERVRFAYAGYGDRFRAINASFADLDEVMAGIGWETVDGIVVDLGVSSYQLDDPERGFGFMRNGPLDMRMDRSLSVTAADLVNTLGEMELANLIYALGEERHSRKIARAVAAQRREKPFTQTGELAEVVKRAVPHSRDFFRIHPATRTFQALRLAVNRELETIERFLDVVPELLAPGGRLSVVAFHSLEDRLVKRRFRDWARPCRCPERAIRCECGGEPLMKLLTRKAMKPGEEEVEQNPRARSARLRGVEKVGSGVRGERELGDSGMGSADEDG